MNKKDLKQKAQDELMTAIGSAFTSANDKGLDREVIKEMSRQMERVEKLFGYKPESWYRGV